jgi:hypothetical protein
MSRAGAAGVPLSEYDPDEALRRLEAEVGGETHRLPSGFWTAERIKVLRTMSMAGDCVEDVAAAFGITWEQVRNACSAHNIRRPSRRQQRSRDSEGERAVALKVVRPVPGSFAAQALAGLSLAESDNRRLLAAQAERQAARVIKLGAVDEGDADHGLVAIVAKEEHAKSVEERAWAQIHAWRDAGVTPIEACRQLDVLHNRNWDVVAHHLMQKLRRESKPC